MIELLLTNGVIQIPVNIDCSVSRLDNERDAIVNAVADALKELHGNN